MLSFSLEQHSYAFFRKRFEVGSYFFEQRKADGQTCEAFEQNAIGIKSVDGTLRTSNRFCDGSVDIVTSWYHFKFEIDHGKWLEVIGTQWQ